MFWLTKFFTKGKSVKDAIKYFHTINGRPPSGIEIIRIKNAFMDQTRKSNVIDITSRIKDDWWKGRPHPEVTKKTDESPLNTLLSRQSEEIKGVDTKQGLGFYREMGDIMKRHRLEELELEYDTMFNKILEKAKRIDRDPKVLLEAELGKKLTGEETTTQLLEIFKNRPKKASGGIARLGMAGGGALFKFIEKLFIKASNDIRLGRGKWKGFDQKQRIVQHDNLTKKVTEFQKTGNTVGLEEYFGVDPHTAFIGARDKVKRQGIISSKAEIEAQRQKQIMEEAYEEIRGGSGFSGDYKYDADILADSLATVQGKVYDDLADLERSELYDQALTRVQQDLKSKMDFKKNLKDIHQKIELQMFDPKDRKPNAEGGRASLMYGGDPGFQFEYGGSWADWRDRHQHQMPVTDYIKTRLPKERLPFRDMQSGGLAYMLGEPTYMKYGVGGSVGHAPWHKPTGQPQPQGQEQSPTPQVGGAQSPGRGQPNPMKGPRGLPSLAPRTMDPQYMQQQMMQRAMMGQQQMGQGQVGQPRMGMAEGKKVKKKELPEELPPYQGPDYETDDAKEAAKEIIRRVLGEGVMGGPIGGGFQYGVGYGKDKPFDYGIGWNVGDDASGLYADYGIRDDDENVYTGGYKGDNWDIGVRKEEGSDPTFGFNWKKKFNQGGRIGFGLGGINKGRRAFMKWLLGITGAGIAAGSGLLKFGSKAAPKVIKEAEVITRGADGMPKYITDLIEVVKAKGTRDVIEGFKRSDYSTVHSYKGVDVIEDGAGNIKIKKPHEGGGTYTTPEGVDESFDGIIREVEMDITKGGYVKNKKGKMVKEGDEYVEYTARPDMDGKMKDVDEYIDDMDHLDLKEIADEVDTLIIKKTKKASGGLAYMLGE